jgi:hypothetical protein
MSNTKLPSVRFPLAFESVMELSKGKDASNVATLLESDKRLREHVHHLICAGYRASQIHHAIKCAAKYGKAEP